MFSGLWWWWWEPQGAPPPFVPSRLQLRDFRAPAGEIVEILALFEADTSGMDLWNGPNGTGSIADPASDLVLDTPPITLSSVHRQSATELVFNRNAGSGWNTAFEGQGVFTMGNIYIQTRHNGVATLPVATTLEDAGFGFMRYSLDAAAQAVVDSIVTGDRFILAMARPAVLTDTLRWGTDTLLWGSDVLRWAA